MNEQKRNIIISISIVTILIVTMIGATYAYFTAFNNQGSTSIISMGSGKMIIKYEDGNNNLLTKDNFQPSNEIIVDKTFTLTGTNTATAAGGIVMPYTVGLKYVSTFSDEQIHYYIKIIESDKDVSSALVGTKNQTILGHASETGYTTGTLNNGAVYTELASGEFKPSNSDKSITFNLKLQFPDTGINQDSEKGKSLSGTIEINYKEETNTSTAVDYIADLYQTNAVGNGIIEDDTNDKNIRYSGINAKNYVLFNNEMWRIIGIFNVVNGDSNKKEKVVKIMRNDSIGNYSFDNTDGFDNETYGLNDWSQSLLMNELNGDYLDTSLTSNPLWPTTEGYTKITAEFNINYVIKSEYQKMINNSVWNYGGINYGEKVMDNTTYTYYNTPAKDVYELEKQNAKYQDSFSSSWVGKIGLINVSDFGYASSSSKCHEHIFVDSYTDSNHCGTNNWMVNNKQGGYTMIPLLGNQNENEVDASGLFEFNSDGFAFYFHHYGAAPSGNVYPSLYLKSNVNILSGDGSEGNPFIVSI